MWQRLTCCSHMYVLTCLGKNLKFEPCNVLMAPCFSVEIMSKMWIFTYVHTMYMLVFGHICHVSGNVTHRHHHSPRYSNLQNTLHIFVVHMALYRLCIKVCYISTNQQER